MRILDCGVRIRDGTNNPVRHPQIPTPKSAFLLLDREKLRLRIEGLPGKPEVVEGDDWFELGAGQIAGNGFTQDVPGAARLGVAKGAVWVGAEGQGLVADAAIKDGRTADVATGGDVGTVQRAGRARLVEDDDRRFAHAIVDGPFCDGGTEGIGHDIAVDFQANNPLGCA